MHARIDNPALTVPGALKPLQEIGNAAKQAGIPETALALVHLRASQINGCGDAIQRDQDNGARSVGEVPARASSARAGGGASSSASWFR